MKCIWCEADGAKCIEDVGYWELPDGTRAIEIQDIPSIKCYTCGIVYQDEKIVEDIEDQLLLVNTSNITKAITYERLMNLPRILKRNYFRF